ncbi:hypothetical protein [Rhizobium sp. MHM7A]|uniref:hypothetical protein n=1 Tax=Rhizobium sp. MHM7A TaxID=2583233 RepID=UPI001106BFA4|nr:hypothetical protein [Rhizobium sp. MHM7A]TLX13375.1 hypothetical protein FFR93_15485 [Rhizobium sp. MHM7A]
MIRRVRYIEEWALRILCALTLVLVGFAHQPPAAAGDLGPAGLAQYVLPDGTLPTLCVTVNDTSDQGRQDKIHSHGCEACRISASALMPAPADAAGAPIVFAAAVELPRRAESFRRRPFPPNTRPRAPPSDPILA